MKKYELFPNLTVVLISAVVLSACAAPPPRMATTTAIATITVTPAVPSPEVTSEATVASPTSAITATLTSTLTAQPWLWSRLMSVHESDDIQSPDLYRMTFGEDGTVQIKADCNTATGTYAIDGEALSITLGPATIAACASGSRSEQFITLLSKANKIAIDPSPAGVSLVLAAGSELLFLGPAFPNAIDLCGDKALTLNTITSTLDVSITTRLDEMLTGLLRGGPRAAPGVSFLVITPQGRYFKSTGVANVTTCAPLAADAPYQVGSNTKMMTAAMIFQLQEEGKLTTADPLAKWLPELAAKIPNGETITLDMLLTHTSGIYDYINGVIDDGPLSKVVSDRDLLVKGFTPEELVQLAIDNGQPTAQPGTKFGYSNTGYVLLGLVIEQATGKSYDENLQTRILQPLGLKNTYLLAGVPEPGTLPQGYLQPPFDYTAGGWNTSQGWAAGAVVSTSEDFAVFLKALFTGKLFKDAATLGLMQAHTDAGVGALGPGTVYAHGMMNNRGVLGHGGQTPGFQSDGGYVPGDDVTIVIWGNSSENNVNRLRVPEIAEIVGAKIEPADATAGAALVCATDLPYPRPEPAYSGKVKRDFAPFAEALQGYTSEQATARAALVSGKTIPELQALMQSGDLSSADLVVYYLERIQRYDVDKLNAVLELNPEALDIARALDDERASGQTRGSMHGIPVLLKANIATGDQMHTTAGAAAMSGWRPSRDAFLAQRLREAGAVILGKANLSEWANYMDPCMPNGFSTLGGQTRNPYGPFDTWGSSSGSAVAVAADLATISIGTETQGSIIAPAGINSVVGLKPSLGLVSRDYVIPLLPWQDTPGPMGRTITDVAVLLTAMTGVDPNDAETSKASSLAGADFAQYLKPEARTSIRVGIPVWNDAAFEDFFKKLPDADEESKAKLRKAFEAENAAPRAVGQVLSAAGFTVVEVPQTALPTPPDTGPALEYGYRDAINAFLASLGEAAPVKSLADIIAFNSEDLKNRAPYGQSYLTGSQATTITAESYAAIERDNPAQARAAIDQLLTQFNIDVIVSTVNQAYAPAGYPALSVPSGYGADGKPEDTVFVGGYLSEPKLLAVGAAYEQATKARVAPNLETTLKAIEALK